MAIIKAKDICTFFVANIEFLTLRSKLFISFTIIYRPMPFIKGWFFLSISASAYFQNIPIRLQKIRIHLKNFLKVSKSNSFAGKIGNRMTYKFSVLGLAFLGLLSITSCRNDDDDELIGNWVRVSDLDGKPRSNASAFVLNGLGYISGGYDGQYYYNDLWSYDPNSNYWTQKADFPGVKRSSAVGFATNSYGYIGTGYDGLNKLADFYRYDAASNSWTQIADFPGTARYAALAFGIGTKGYVGTGYDGSELKDFFKYDEDTSSWSSIVSLGGSKRRDGAAFVINNIAYVGFGSNNGSLISDFWAFDPSTESWTRKTDTVDDDNDENQTRTSPATFTSGGKGYVTTGSYSGVVKTTWEYNPSTNDWVQRSDFEGSARESACAFTIGDYGYVLTGNSGSSYFDDIWVFHPTAEQNDDD